MSHSRDSNPRPTRYECVALPAELKWPANHPPPIGKGLQKYYIFLILHNSRPNYFKFPHMQLTLKMTNT